MAFEQVESVTIAKGASRRPLTRGCRFFAALAIDFTDALPRLPTGKLYKKPLRDRYWQGHGKSRIV